MSAASKPGSVPDDFAVIRGALLDFNPNPARRHRAETALARLEAQRSLLIAALQEIDSELKIGEQNTTNQRRRVIARAALASVGEESERGS